MIYLVLLCQQLVLESKRLYLNKDDDDQVWKDFAKPNLVRGKKQELGIQKQTFSSKDASCYLKLTQFINFNENAIDILGNSRPFSVFLSECVFAKLSVKQNKAPAVINFRANCYALLNKCCSRECKTDGNKAGAFIYCSKSCNHLRIVSSIISTCESSSTEGSLILFIKISYNSRNKFDMNNVNVSRNNLQKYSGFFTQNLNIAITQCTFADNTAQKESICFHNTDKTEYNNVVFIRNTIINSDDKSATIKMISKAEISLTAVYFIDNNCQDYYGGKILRDNIIKSGTTEFSHLISLICEDVKKDPISELPPERTPLETPSTTPQTTPSITPSTTPSTSPMNTPFITPSNTPSSTPLNTPAATPSSTPSNTPSATPSANDRDDFDYMQTQMPIAYSMYRKHIMVGEH